MTASAAAAAGYTLAAGPVRADVDQDRHQRPQRRRRQGQGRRTATCRSISRGRRARQSARHPRRDGDLRPARIHQGRDAASRQARRVRDRAELLFPQGRRSHQDHRHAAADADRERQARCGAVRRSRRHRGLGQIAGRRHQHGSASSASAAAAAPSGTMPPTTPASRPASRSTAAWSTRANPLWPKSPTQLAPDMKAPVLGLYGESRHRHSGRAGRGDEGGARGRTRRPPNSRSIPARRTASMPIIGRATARRPPRTPGTR